MFIQKLAETLNAMLSSENRIEKMSEYIFYLIWIRQLHAKKFYLLLQKR